MALVKRGKIWHTHFFVDGQRFRQSLDTSDWREAQAKEKELISSASQGKLAPASQHFSKLNVTAAIELYLADRAGHVQLGSRRSESDHAATISAICRLPVLIRDRFWHMSESARPEASPTPPSTWRLGYCGAF